MSPCAVPAQLVTFRRDLPADPAAIRPLRRELRNTLEHEWGLAGPLDDLVLVVAEVLANAVRHAGGPTVRVLARRFGGGVVIAVRDGSAEPPVLHTPDPSAETGRGVLLLDTLTQENAGRWGVQPLRTGGKLVWLWWPPANRRPAP